MTTDDAHFSLGGRGRQTSFEAPRQRLACVPSSSHLTNQPAGGRVIAGFRIFSLGEAATLLEDALEGAFDDDPDSADARYASIIPDDEVIANRFRVVLMTVPDASSPL